MREHEEPVERHRRNRWTVFVTGCDRKETENQEQTAHTRASSRVRASQYPLRRIDKRQRAGAIAEPLRHINTKRAREARYRHPGAHPHVDIISRSRTEPAAHTRRIHECSHTKLHTCLVAPPSLRLARRVRDAAANLIYSQLASSNHRVCAQQHGPRTTGVA